MEEIVEVMHNLLFSALTIGSPVLSGNMKSRIRAGLETPHVREIVIDAPFYDLKRWKKDKTIILTGEIKNGRTAYAEWVNRAGGFFTHNKSMHWVNHAVLGVVYVIANELNAEVVYGL